MRKITATDYSVIESTIFFGLKPGAKINKLRFELKWKKNIESFQDRMKNADLVVVTRDLKKQNKI